MRMVFGNPAAKIAVLIGVSLGWQMVAQAAPAAFAGAAALVGPAILDCRPAVQRYLSTDLAILFPDNEAGNVLGKISGNLPDSVPITFLTARDYWYLKFRFEARTRALSVESRESCLRLSREVSTLFEDRFKTRLAGLLAVTKVDEFYKESALLLQIGATDLERRELRKLIQPFEVTYFENIRGRLVEKLTSLRWKNYSQLKFEVTSWNQEWSKLLGREAPAGVDLRSGRIALRPLDYSPGELQLFLFHELAHLADPRAAGLQNRARAFFGAEERYANEVYAWRETAAFIDFLGAQAEPMPGVFVKIRRGIELLGVEEWVKQVLLKVSGK